MSAMNPHENVQAFFAKVITVSVQVSALNEITDACAVGEFHSLLELLEINCARAVDVDVVEKGGSEESLSDERARGLDALHAETAYGTAVSSARGLLNQTRGEGGGARHKTSKGRSLECRAHCRV